MKKIFLLSLLFLGISCSSVSAQTSSWKPALNDSFYIQLQGEFNSSSVESVKIVDVDLFDTTAEEIKEFHKAGKKVICYFSAGSYENWRADARLFPIKAIGNDLDNWEGERWLDVRSDVVRLIMQIRIMTAVVKGCDGVDPDNVDGYTNKTGFPLTYADSRDFNLFLANQAHTFGLAIGLKNGMDMLPDLSSHFDFAVNEQCHEYKECGTYKDFLALGKPVFNLEYQSKYKKNTNLAFTKMCKESKKLGLSSYVYPIDLAGSFVLSCVK